jgi:hypothetical protein
MEKAVWYHRKSFWRRGLIYLVVLVVGVVIVRWRWQVKQERQAEQIRTEERRLVKELVAHYTGVKRVRFQSVIYTRMAGSTTYTFLVNQQKDPSSYLVEKAPGHHDTPMIGYSESFYETNERQQPLSAAKVDVGRVQVSYTTDLKKA